MRLFTIFLAIFLAAPAAARLLDPDATTNALLQRLAPLLEAHAVDVAYNLNNPRTKPGRSLSQARLGMLADMPLGTQAGSAELNQWEDAYRSKLILALVAVPGVNHIAGGGYESDWFASPLLDRVFVTLAAADLEAGNDIASQLQSIGYRVLLLSAAVANTASAEAGRLYATAGQRLVLDSPSARYLAVETLEFKLLGRKLRRKTNSVYPQSGKSSRYYAQGEPKRFRKADLGNESTAAVIPEIIVSGGIALGEVATFQEQPRALTFNTDRGFELQLADGQLWVLPSQPLAWLKACFDFALRSTRIESDAIIDIDEKRNIKMSSAFRDTDIGYTLIDVDEQPFRFVPNLNVVKSVIIDRAVYVGATQSMASFRTDYEIRFINPDRRKLAETRAALVYEYNSSTDLASFRESWGPRAFRTRSADLAGLGEQTRSAARVAGWVALFRSVAEGELEFSRGRYEFLKIKKMGRATPRRSPVARD
jgi:hypothetical protein